LKKIILTRSGRKPVSKGDFPNSDLCESSMPKVTLTFDNGPDPNITPQVLDTLATYHLRATFFVVGQKLAQPGGWEIAARVVASGHWLGNHTFTHTTPLGNSQGPTIAEVEIGQTQQLIGSLAHPDKLFRPFGGGGALGPHLLSRACYEFLRAGSYTCVLWNSVPRDWEDPAGWVERALADCRAKAWTLLVLHDIDTGAMKYLDGFIQSLLAQGSEIVQDFPPDCVPLRRGEVIRPMQGYIND
jgi:peptidoglycan/xylan/chitin deacetylase (PgdA/CDA1 family)